MKIKELRLEYQRLEHLGDLWKNINAVAADFAGARRQAEEYHRRVQETATLSQKKHEQLNPLYEKLKQLREKEKLLAAQHLQLKEQYRQTKELLETVSSRVKELSQIFSENEKKSFKEQLKEKTAQVSEKIKKREKLSMEDILAFQAGEK